MATDHNIYFDCFNGSRSGGRFDADKYKTASSHSSIGHMGYGLIGLALANEAGIGGVLIYLAIYLFMNVGTFGCIMCMRRNGQAAEQITDLSGVSKTHPMMAFALMVFMFSMAGMVPLVGFFGKWFIFLAAIEAKLYALAIIGVISSVVANFLLFANNKNNVFRRDFRTVR